MINLRFMGEGPVEQFRCRVYGGIPPAELARRAFMKSLACDGVIECPAYDAWLSNLKDRGWADFEEEPASDALLEWTTRQTYTWGNEHVIDLWVDTTDDRDFRERLRATFPDAKVRRWRLTDLGRKQWGLIQASW